MLIILLISELIFMTFEVRANLRRASIRAAIRIRNA
jgi:hypothetical protein